MLGPPGWEVATIPGGDGFWPSISTLSSSGCTGDKSSSWDLGTNSWTFMRTFLDSWTTDLAPVVPPVLRLAQPAGLAGHHPGWSPPDPTYGFVGGVLIMLYAPECAVPWLHSPLLETPGKGEHFISNLHADVIASKGCVPLGHIAFMLDHTKSCGLCPIGIICLGELHLGQFTCHCHILCKKLGILSIPPGHHSHFLPPH